MTASHGRVWWRQRLTRPAAGLAQRIVVVTDADGTLAGPGAQSVEVHAALDFLAARGIPLVINSSRTRAEVEWLHQTLQIRAPFMSENGGALFLPQGSFPEVPGRARPGVGCDVIEFGRRYRDIVDALRLTCREVEADVICFAGLSIDEAARDFGVALATAQLAKLREYSELVRIVDQQDATRRRLFRALRRRGLFCRPAGGHHLVTATADRAESLRTLRAIWKRTWGDPIIIGLGGSDADVAWLRHVNIAVIVDHGQADLTAR